MKPSDSTSFPRGGYIHKECKVHAYHSPRQEYCQRHHILPLSWGGKSEGTNLISICPTGHANIHYLLDQYEEHDGTPPWDILRSFGPKERKLAELGWKRYLKSLEK